MPKVSNSNRGKTCYVQSARLNGKSLERAWITRSEITGVRVATKLQNGESLVPSGVLSSV